MKRIYRIGDEPMKERKGAVCILLPGPGSNIIYLIYDCSYDRNLPYFLI